MKLNVLSLLCAMLFLAASCSNKGKPLPELNVTDLDGVTWTSESLKGKIVVLNVWATWCGTCIQEIPALNALQEKYKDQEVVFIGLNDESREKVKASLQRFPFNYHQVADVEAYTSSLQTRFVKTYPQNLVVDRKGEVVYDVSDGLVDIYSELDEVISLNLNH